MNQDFASTASTEGSVQTARQAKSHVDNDIAETEQTILKYVGDIVSAAIENGDDQTALNGWKQNVMSKFNTTSKSSGAFRKFQTVGKLYDAYKDAFTFKRQITKKKNMLKDFAKPLESKELLPISIWKGDIDAALQELRAQAEHAMENASIHSVDKITRQQSDHASHGALTARRQNMLQWIQDLRGDLHRYLTAYAHFSPEDLRHQGLNVVYEIWHLVFALRAGQPALFTGTVIAPWYTSDQVLMRCRTTSVIATTMQRSLNKRRMGLRAAGIYGVSH